MLHTFFPGKVVTSMNSKFNMEDQDFGLLPGSTDPNMITLQPLQPNDVSYILIFLKLKIHGLLTSSKKRTDEFDLFAFLLFTANKSNSSVCFLGESTARQSAFDFI